MKKSEAHILKAYIKEHIRSLIFYGIIVIIISGISWIYGYEEALSNMSYAVLIIAFFGAIYGISDYIRYRHKCHLLLNAMEKGSEQAHYLPESSSYIEELYQDMLLASEQRERGAISEFDEKKQDMADYYTMWTHQIKTPIAALRLLLQQEKQPLEELFKIEQYAEMALHYARLDSLSSDLLFHTQDLCAIIRQAVKKYSILFIGSGLSFTMEDFSAHAVTDEKWLAFVIGQILSNALKYTNNGQIRIYGMDRQRRETNGEASFIVIEDSGIGIRDEDLPRIFERGFTGYNGRLDRKSTGIGLYLCRQIMDRLSHTIDVESRAGEGTKVILGFIQEAYHD